MSPTNDVTVPPHLTKSGATDEPTTEPSSRALNRRTPLLMALGGIIIFALGGLVGNVLAHRSDNPSLATVNGVPIDQQAYNHRCETVVVNNATVGAQVMRQMIQEELALQYAAKQGVTPTDAEVDRQYDEAAKAPNFAEQARKSLQTTADLKHQIKVSLSQAAVIDKGITITDQDIQNFYKDNTDPAKYPQARYYTPDAVQVAVIISDKEQDINNAIHDLATGIPFVQVAQKYSKDQSRANGGVLPPIRRGTLNNKQFPGLENIVFSLQVNQQTDRIKVGNAFWLVRCIGRSQESTKPFDQVKEECRKGALLLKGYNANGKTVQADYQNFVKSADLKALQPQYADAVNINGK